MLPLFCLIICLTFCTLLIIGIGISTKLPVSSLEYVLTDVPACRRGAGFKVGGSRVICARLIGINNGAVPLAGLALLVDGNGSDFLNRVRVCFVTGAFVVAVFDTLTTLLSPGTGRNVAFVANSFTVLAGDSTTF